MQAQCAEGYTGNLCGVCDKFPDDPTRTPYGFYAPFKCTKCKSEGAVIALSLVGFFAQFIFVIFTILSNIQTNQERYVTGDSQPSDFIKVGLVVGLQADCCLDQFNSIAWFTLALVFGYLLKKLWSDTHPWQLHS